MVCKRIPGTHKRGCQGIAKASVPRAYNLHVSFDVGVRSNPGFVSNQNTGTHTWLCAVFPNDKGQMEFLVGTPGQRIDDASKRAVVTTLEIADDGARVTVCGVAILMWLDALPWLQRDRTNHNIRLS
jgi:hypothetical protein